METKKEDGSAVMQYEEEQILSPQELKQAENFAARIDLNHTIKILQYGAGTQKKIADFSGKALESVQTKDLSEVGELLSRLTAELRGWNPAEAKENWFLAFFRKRENKRNHIKAQYEKIEVNVEKMVEVLEGHRIQLMKNVALLEQMYEMNQSYLKELSMYILAGKKKSEKARNEEMALLKAKAIQSGLREDVQEADDYAAQIDRFEKRIHDLKVTRMVALQMAPQIRLIQNNNTLVIEKIRSVIVNAIPVWKSQMLIAFGMEHAGQSAQASKNISDMTNRIFRNNAALIETINEAMCVQKDGREKSRQAEADLAEIEQRMKVKLQEISYYKGETRANESQIRK